MTDANKKEDVEIEKFFVSVALELFIEMLQSYLENIIKDFCTFFGKSVEGIEFENEAIPEVRLKGIGAVKGFRNAVEAVCDNKTKKSEELAIQDQWIEYAFTNAAFLQNSSNISHILKELNEHLSDKVYIAGNKQTPPDILVYLFVYDVMVNLTFQEKEEYMNVSRWFDNMQQDGKLRSWRNMIHFSRTRLYA